MASRIEILMTAFSLAASAACARSTDILDFGARGDGTTDNTAAIQKAIDECSISGGGRVLVPGGGVYKTYTLNLKNNVDLHIERGATLKGGEDPYKYPEFGMTGVWNSERAPRFNKRAMFYTVGQTNVAITGTGTIDGNAEAFHHKTGRKNWTGYHWWRNSDTNITGRCVFFVGCRDVRLDDVLIFHPAGWSTWFLDCDRVGVRGVRIEADHRFPNGDGLHFGGCREVVVSDCIIDSQDDSLIIRTHQEQMKKPRPCERVAVDNCILRSGGAYAIRLGWTGDGPMRDVAFNNIVCSQSRWGVGFTAPSEPAPPREWMDPPRGRGLVPPPPESLLPFSAENIRFSNMSVACDRSFDLVSLGNTTPVAFIRDVSFSHCRFTMPGPPRIACRPQDNVRDWRLSDVVFEFIAPLKGSSAPNPHDFLSGIADVDLDNVKCVASGASPLFWHLVLAREGASSPVEVESVRQKCRVTETTKGTRRYEYDALAVEGTTLDIKVTIDERTTPAGRTYAGTIKNNAAGMRVTAFDGPRLDKVGVRQATASLYVPNGFGKRLRFPASTEDAAPWNDTGHGFSSYETGLYPGRDMTMPWIALDTGAGTYYAAVHDARARPKSLGVRWYRGEGGADVRFHHRLSLRAGEKWNLPQTVFEKIGGDWHDAARRYRAWFDSVHAVRAAAPAWTADVAGWLLVIMKQQNGEVMWTYADIPKLCDVAERNGLDCLGLFGWTVGGHDHLYPDYDPDPKMGGVAALKAGIAEAHRRGIRVCIYANGQLQQVGATKFWDQYGKDLALVKRDGSPLIQTYHKYRDIPVYKFALGCLGGRAWADRMSSLARQAGDFGADAILYDQLGVTPPFECWGQGHGHPVPWYSYGEERPDFLRRIADAMHGSRPDFALFTEGLHDTVLDAVSLFHSWTPGSFRQDAERVRARPSGGVRSDVGEPFPELWRYTFPEVVLTTRFPTPMSSRTMANYAVAFGLRHEIEIRYMPDRAYALDGKVPGRADYGEVKNLPSIDAMRSTPPAAASAYLKAVCDFQRAHAKYLMRGRFVDDEGFAATASGIVAKRFVAADGTSAVCVWNAATTPTPVEIDGLGAARAVFAPSTEPVDGPLAADSIRLYVYGEQSGGELKPHLPTQNHQKGQMK